VAIGVGATLDSLAGRIKRAPQWMRRSGMEWLYRLWHEPGQLYWRYASDLLHFVSILAAQWWRFASSAETPARPRENAPAAPGWCSVDAGSRLTRHSLQHEAEFWHNLRHRRSHCVMDLSRVRRVDSTGVAFLIRCRKELQSAGWQLVLLAPSTPLRRVLAILQLSDYFVIASDLTEATRCGESLVTSVTCRDGTTRSLAWCGELVAANCEDVWQMTTDHIRAFVGAHATLIIVDLNRLRFTDSSGAALMLRLKKWTRSLRAELLFAHAQPNVRNVLRLTQLDQFLLEGSQ
jgi:N-acetylglucosaminyldiphosphoundecaprenol N-acetyl-beta-D-mannosaminyltransferase